MSEKRGAVRQKAAPGRRQADFPSRFQSGYAIGDSIGKTLFGDPAQKARQEAEEAQRAQEAAQEAAMRRKWEEDQARIRAAEDARKRQEAYDRLSSQLQISSNFDGKAGGLTFVGDDDPLRPHGTAFFGSEGNGWSRAGSPAASTKRLHGHGPSPPPADGLQLMIGDPNIVDLSKAKGRGRRRTSLQRSR